MGRQRRHDVAGAWHHVMNRGAGHHDVFDTAGDARQFLELLGDACDHVGARIAAYCLMSNHYHLLVHCPDGGLSTMMCHVGSRYTRYLNGRRGADGPVFRGRFKSKVVEHDEYLATVGRYIHRNPLDIDPSISLDRYRWSSYQYYVGDSAPPPWLTTNELFAGQPLTVFRHFVEHPDAA